MESPPITAADDGGGREKRRIHLKRGVFIVLVGAGATVVVHGVAMLAWALCFDDSARPPIRFSAYGSVRIALIGAVMAGAAMFVWRRPGVIGGLCSIVFALALPLVDILLAQITIWIGQGRSLSFPDITPDFIFQMVLFIAGVWTLPLLSAVLPWRLSVPLGALVLTAYMGFMMWTSWESMEPIMGTGNQRIWFVGSWFLLGTFPVLAGFVAACLMLPRERPRFVSVTTVPRSLTR